MKNRRAGPEGLEPADNNRVRVQVFDKAVDWKGGIRLRLTEAEQAHIQELEGANDFQILDLLAILAENGLKTSISFDRIQGSYTATVFRNRAGFADSGYTLSVSSKYIERCFRALLFAMEDVSDFNILEIEAVRAATELDF